MEPKQKPNTEKMILEAAREEFFVKGLDGARTKMIAERAGVTHAMLHYYFRTKEQLFERIVNETFSMVAETIFAAMGDPTKPVVERIRSGVSAHFDLIAANPQLPRFFLNEIYVRQQYFDILREKMMAVGNGLIPELQAEADAAAERGEIVRTDVSQLLISILSLNIFPFIIAPILELDSNVLLCGLYGDRETFLAARKAENIETIMRRIEKH